ncbi:hypothetical protein Y032_0068g253 [Ancylostoma ceylanicum]|uniref:Uncharacterized protein n=1 Tax=Ancylostoma ceylanicum TaxID=53326 RepID=A0A016TZ04_9BILA|nr:hypothetical protein Y032_0068g253 [Ancylostoma ceylanicum]
MCNSLHRSPQEIRAADSRSASKTAYASTHPITNGHGHQVSFPCEPGCIVPKVKVLAPVLTMDRFACN